MHVFARVDVHKIPVRTSQFERLKKIALKFLMVRVCRSDCVCSYVFFLKVHFVFGSLFKR